MIFAFKGGEFWGLDCVENTCAVSVGINFFGDSGYGKKYQIRDERGKELQTGRRQQPSNRQNYDNGGLPFFKPAKNH